MWRRHGLPCGSLADESGKLGVLTFDHDHVFEVQQSRGDTEFLPESFVHLTAAIGECTVVASMKFHGCVVAAMYGVPAIGLITTDKFRNFYKLIERPELIAHHTHVDLDKRLPFFTTKIPGSTIREVRGEAEAGLVRLRTSMLAALGR